MQVEKGIYSTPTSRGRFEGRLNLFERLPIGLASCRQAFPFVMCSGLLGVDRIDF